MKYNIAIIGATGIVGQTSLKVLEERQLSGNNLYLFASSQNEGKELYVGGRRLKVMLLDEGNLFATHYDYALFCTGDEISEMYVKSLAKKGTVVVDYSSLYRKEFPLIVPEINMNKAQGNILCNPNCSTIAGVMSLYAIHRKFGIERIVYSTYQAVSGAGREALDDMNVSQLDKLKKFDYPIKNNLIPYIGEIYHNGYSKEEEKMKYETRKILNDDDIKITATCVRVPVDVGHCLSINFKTKRTVSLKEIEKTLSESEGVKIVDYPMPMDVRGQDKVLVGRIRDDEEKNSFNIFVASDNLRKGAGQNGVQILERLIDRR